MVQEGAGLALLLGAADSRRRGLVQEVADGSLHEHYSSPKLGSAHASVSNLDAQLRSLAAAGAGAPHASAYPAYYSSYYHYYYGYPVSDSLQQHHQQDQHHSTSVAEHTEHGLNHVETPIATVTSSYNSTYGIQSGEPAATSNDFDLGVNSGSSNGSANPPTQQDPRERNGEGNFSSSPTADYDLMAQQCNMNSSIKNSLGAYQNIFEASQSGTPNSHLSYPSQNYNQISDYPPLASGYAPDQRAVPPFSESSHQEREEPESTSDTEPDSSMIPEAP